GAFSEKNSPATSAKAVRVAIKPGRAADFFRERPSPLPPRRVTARLPQNRERAEAFTLPVREGGAVRVRRRSRSRASPRIATHNDCGQGVARSSGEPAPLRLTSTA